MERDLIVKLINEELRSSNEVAEELSITKQGVAKLVARGELTPVKTMPNASLFWEQDVEKIKIRKKLISSVSPQEIWGGSTDEFREDFKKIVNVEDVIAVYIYFYDAEAALDGFFTTNKIAKKDTLMRIKVPSFVVKYSDLSEEYFDGALCGYGGNGPSGSYDVLVKSLGVPEEQAQKLYNARSIKFYKEGKVWRHTLIYRNHDTNDDGFWYHQNINYLYNNQFVLLKNIRKRDFELNFENNNQKLLIYEENKWFIPNVETITIYPREVAIQTGHYTLSTTHRTIYPVVVRDRSGRELWLDIDIDEKKYLLQQDRLMDIIYAFGFSVKDNDRNEERMGIIKNILDRIIKLDEPITFSKHLDVKC